MSKGDKMKMPEKQDVPITIRCATGEKLGQWEAGYAEGSNDTHDKWLAYHNWRMGRLPSKEQLRIEILNNAVYLREDWIIQPSDLATPLINGLRRLLNEKRR